VATDTEQTITHATSGFKNIHLTAMLVTEAVTGPAAVVHGDLFTRRKTYDVFPTFDMAVTGFDASDLVVSGGSVVDFEGEGRYYTATIAVDAAAQSVQVTVPSGSTFDATTGDLSLVSNTLITENLAPTGPQWIIDDQPSWTAAAETSTNVDISDGALTPTAATGVYGSQVQGFGRLRKATHLTLEQVPVWDNWSPISNVGPSAARDAVVLLPVADDQYYLLGRYLSAQSYHAWFSSDMENWFYRGQVVPDGDGRWVTSADIIDGVTYIYSDVPNDQNPHVFIDDNLDDGIPGIAGGAVLVKDPCGSDSSFFRNDSDGLMHVIYEEWSPINARQNSWDSPLAGHASSADGVNGFVHHEHRPAVDVRTTPTGVTQTYSHPQIGTCSYEVHEPAQDAFGDWTTIKVGEQYYMFGDFDSHDGGIRVGRFTSSSIFRQFEFVGELGAGHPDPTVGFAEGQFYLVTQQSTDYVSPGPWVDGVEARAGVDVDGDGVVDQWADWQSVAESYALKEGYALVVEATPAALDLSDLPAGQGFAFQIRLDNGAAPVTPMIDRVTLQFE
ncbi:MAG: Ig-like domain-containing protein, partial [Pseudomonadota bacterium]